jgi:hypothetical protein
MNIPESPEARRMRVYAMRHSGMTFREIGEHFGFGAHRARCLFIMASHWLQWRMPKEFHLPGALNGED